MVLQWNAPEMDGQVAIPRPALSAHSAPGKVFLLGEYAVLGGAPAIMASVGPRFQLLVRNRTEDSVPWVMHPQSPVSRLIDWAGRAGVGMDLELEFVDPFEGRGGFGASTAQFVLTYRALGAQAGWDQSWKAVWGLYRELMHSRKEAVPPSGADLIVQWQGGVVLFGGIADPARAVDDLWGSGFDWSSLLVFSATRQPGRKVATHEHLTLLSELGPGHFEILERPLSEGIDAISRRDRAGFGRAMEQYARALGSLGLECEASRRDRMAFLDVPGVLGVKGAGAMQSDAILVLVDPMSSARAEVLELAKKRRLELLCDGLTFQSGVVCDE